MTLVITLALTRGVFYFAMFLNRHDAGRQLAERLRPYQGREDALVLAVPRGGVPVGYEIAKALQLPLEVVHTKKIGYPGRPEYAIGAVSLTGRVLNENAGVSMEYIESETLRIRESLRDRQQRYRPGMQAPMLKDRCIIVVDDGVATGYTLAVTLELVRSESPARTVVALPVGPPSAIRQLAEAADEVICLLAPADMVAIGYYYRDFEQVKDAEVIRYLNEINR